MEKYPFSLFSQPRCVAPMILGTQSFDELSWAIKLGNFSSFPFLSWKFYRIQIYWLENCLLKSLKISRRRIDEKQQANLLTSARRKFNQCWGVGIPLSECFPMNVNRVRHDEVECFCALYPLDAAPWCCLFLFHLLSVSWELDYKANSSLPHSSGLEVEIKRTRIHWE